MNQESLSPQEFKSGIFNSHQPRTSLQILEAVAQEKRTWELDSTCSLQTGHKIESISIPRDERLRRWGSLSKNIRHMKMLTFRGIILYHLVLGRELVSMQLSICFRMKLTE
ncbi:hypothetical protein Tco_1541974 [Tanacetum coccineum]